MVVCDTKYGSIGHMCSHVSPAHDQTGAHTVQGFVHRHHPRSSLSHQLSTSPAWQAAGRGCSRGCSLSAFGFPATGTCWSPGPPSICEWVSESSWEGGCLDAGPANCHSHPMSPSQHCWVLAVPGTGEAASATGSWGGSFDLSPGGTYRTCPRAKLQEHSRARVMPGQLNSGTRRTGVRCRSPSGSPDVMM